MRTRTLFQYAIDQWNSVAATSRADVLPFLKKLEELCDSTTNLYVVDMKSDDPLAYSLERVIEHVDLRGPTQTLGDYPDRAYMERDVVPFYKDVKETGVISVMRMTSQIQDQVAVYDRLILPSRPDWDGSRWAVTLSKTRLLLPIEKRALTSRQEDILDLLAHGCSSKEIAAQLALSYRTVEHQIAAIKTKLGARNVVHAVAIGVARHLIGSPPHR